VAACPFKALVHAEHPPHVELQQTPSATTPEVHWEPEVAGLPFDSFAAQVPATVSQ
jgi:xanthine dehydrogenase molybdopterin-binding subunit B